MQRFIVGTGRCGSTIFSTLLSHHPDALVLSEFFAGLDLVNAFQPGIVSGVDFAKILLQDHEVSGLNRLHNRRGKEIVADLSGYESVRIPAILLVCLPSISDDPEALFRDIIGWARYRSPAPLSEHYPALFEWLMQLLGKEFWIERSGGAGEFFPELRRTFPHARYIHIHRDGVESALSMLNHDNFALHISFYVDPPTDDEIARAIRREDAPGYGLVDRRLANPLPAGKYGEFWTLQICRILSEAHRLGPGQYCEMRFEDLHADPRTFLKDACDNFGISSDDRWIDQSLALIREDNNRRREHLSKADLEELLRAVFPGQVLLRREGTERPNRDVFHRIRTVWDQIAPCKAVTVDNPLSNS